MKSLVYFLRSFLLQLRAVHYRFSERGCERLEITLVLLLAKKSSQRSKRKAV